MATSADSPVRTDSSTALLPATTSPSTGIVSPGRTFTVSPAMTSSVRTTAVSKSFHVSSILTEGSSPFLATPLWSNTSIDSLGTRDPRALSSLVARRFALRSKTRPSKITDRSITGSSRRWLESAHAAVAGRPRACERPTARAAPVPTPTRVFMLGTPFFRDLKPSTMMSRPGPTSAAVAAALCTNRLPKRVKPASEAAPMAAWPPKTPASWWSPAAWKTWPRW